MSPTIRSYKPCIRFYVLHMAFFFAWHLIGYTPSGNHAHEFGQNFKRAPRGLQEGVRMDDNSKTLQDTSTYAKTFILPRVFNTFTHTLRYIRRATYAKTFLLPRVFNTFKINPPPNEGKYMQTPSFYQGFLTLLRYIRRGKNSPG